MRIFFVAALLLGYSALAGAQSTTNCQTNGTRTTCRTTSDPDYSYLHNAGQAGLAQAGQSLGAILGGTLQGKKLISAILTIKCEIFTELTRIYSDGTIEKSSVEVPVDRSQLAAVQQATHGALATVEMGCDAQTK